MARIKFKVTFLANKKINHDDHCTKVHEYCRNKREVIIECGSIRDRKSSLGARTSIRESSLEEFFVFFLSQIHLSNVINAAFGVAVCLHDF